MGALRECSCTPPDGMPVVGGGLSLLSLCLWDVTIADTVTDPRAVLGNPRAALSQLVRAPTIVLRGVISMVSPEGTPAGGGDAVL